MSYDKARSCSVKCDRSAPKRTADAALARNDISHTLLLGMCRICLRQKITKARNTVQGTTHLCYVVVLVGPVSKVMVVCYLNTNLGTQQ
jgi:hypothetical protein